MPRGAAIPLRIVVAPAPSADTQAAHNSPWIFRLTFAAMIALFAVSSMRLTYWDFNYESAGGSIIEKMHPGSWLAMIAAAVAAASNGYWRPVVRFLSRHPLLIAYLATWLLLLAYIILVQKLPFTPIIDTFFLPLVIFFLLDSLQKSEMDVLAKAMHIFMLINSLAGLGEVITGWRITPYVVGTEEITVDWRATAFMGHPLANACITGTYALMLLTGGGKTLTGIFRTVAIIGAMVGMIVFGGRAAMVFLLALSLPMMLINSLKGIAFGRTSYRSAAFGALATLVVPISLAALASAGAFDKFVSRFVEDRGSANTRVVMFELFDEIPLRDILLGPHPDVLATLRTIEGLDYGVESFWIATILAYGMLISLIFFIGLLCYCIELVRFTNLTTILPLLYFFGVASTSVSLSAKSCIFAIFTAMVIILGEHKSGRTKKSFPGIHR